MSNYSNTIDLNYPESHMILIGWVRYCLGRKTSAVSECCDWLIPNWTKIHPNTQAVIYRDIKEEIDQDNRLLEMQKERLAQGDGFNSVAQLRFWDDCDRVEWESVLSAIELKKNHLQTANVNSKCKKKRR